MTSVLPDSLSAKFKNSFAFKTIKDRLPVILTKVIDTAYRQRHNISDQYGQPGLEELKLITGALSELRYRLATDKPLLALKGSRKDVDQWNNCLKDYESKHPTEYSWFKCPWLLAECYMYRQIAEAFDCSSLLKQFDPFRFQKEESFIGCLSKMTTTASYLQEWEGKKEQNGDDKTSDEKIFAAFLQISLWGNKFDLSISSGDVIHHVSPVDHAQELHPFILCDDSTKLYEKVRAKNFPNRRLDIILDNAGLELFGDLCLAEYFIRQNIVDIVVFHVKSIPWFVSDVTHSDFTWTLEMLSCNESPVLKHYGRLWNERRDSGQFRVTENDFWTYAFPYCEMKRVSPSLYDYLSQSDLLIFKGDLNYRKLVSDLNWSFSTPFEVALRGFEPSPLIALRTLKADVVTGITESSATEAAAKDVNWLISGDYAVIQYHARD